MSNTGYRGPVVSGTVVVVGAVSAFCFVVAAVVVLVVAAPAGTDAMPYVAALLGSLGTLVTGVLALVGLRSIDSKVTDLTNGVMDSKIRAGVADVLRSELVDPDAEHQLVSDRVTRAERSSHPPAAG